MSRRPWHSGKRAALELPEMYTHTHHYVYTGGYTGCPGGCQKCAHTHHYVYTGGNTGCPGGCQKCTHTHHYVYTGGNTGCPGGCQKCTHTHITMFTQVAIPDVLEAARHADILVFVLPHQFVRKVCNQLQGHLKDGVVAVSLIKVRMFLHVPQ